MTNVQKAEVFDEVLRMCKECDTDSSVLLQALINCNIALSTDDNPELHGVYMLKERLVIA
mgnify:CR=1 FL=1